jgi:hypothetical protein
LLSRSKAGVPAGTKGRLGGFLSRRARTLPVRAAAARLEGPPERAETIPKKGTYRLGGVARKNADHTKQIAQALLPSESVALGAGAALWVVVAGSCWFTLITPRRARNAGVVDFACLRRFGSGVSALRNKLPVVLLLAIWFAATQHCGLESLGLVTEHIQEGGVAGCCSGTDDFCARDGCNTVENGTYKPNRDIKLAAPQFVVCAWQICLQSIVPQEPPYANILRHDFERSDPGATTWHFVQRAALPARAPSLSLA